MFADTAKIIIRSGKGGDGHVSFRREKYVPDGGPDGGDGGKGGDVIFVTDNGLNTLSDYRHKRKYSASDGEEGKKRRCHGADGEDIVLKVPKGTVIKEAQSGRVIADMSGDQTRCVVLTGGRGGRGNMNFATPTMQAPKYASPGQPAKELEVILELKLIADVGLIGFPNAGKSTFLSRVTNAKPKIAAYPFTTLNPILGVVDFGDGQGFVIADTPGLIEGASKGAGLGHRFLRHIERNRMFIHLVDAASFDGREPCEDVRMINEELNKYDPSLNEKPCVIAANKIDAISLENKEAVLDALRSEFENENTKVFAISAVTGEGINDLLYYVKSLLASLPAEDYIFESEFDPDLEMAAEELPFTVSFDEKEKVYLAEGPRIERMLGYTNLESEKGFAFFQKFIKESGIHDSLKKAGIKEGDTVRIYGWEFEFYDE